MRENDNLKKGDLVEVRWRPAGLPQGYTSQRGMIIDELPHAEAKTGMRFYTVLLTSGVQKLCADHYVTLLRRHIPGDSGAGQPL